jgi:hypothetical protein
VAQRRGNRQRHSGELVREQRHRELDVGLDLPALVAMNWRYERRRMNASATQEICAAMKLQPFRLVSLLYLLESKHPNDPTSMDRRMRTACSATTS